MSDSTPMTPAEWLVVLKADRERLRKILDRPLTATPAQPGAAATTRPTRTNRN